MAHVRRCYSIAILVHGSRADLVRRASVCVRVGGPEALGQSARLASIVYWCNQKARKCVQTNVLSLTAGLQCTGRQFIPFTPKFKKYILCIFIFHLRNQVLHTVSSYISGEAAGEIWNWALLGVKGLKPVRSARLYEVRLQVAWLRRDRFLTQTPLLDTDAVRFTSRVGPECSHWPIIHEFAQIR